MGTDGYWRGVRRHRTLAPLRRVWGYLRNDWIREGERMRRQRPQNLFQPYCVTVVNRHPRCFAFAREALGDAGPLNLLSFGCATGAEAFTLAQYFPGARVKGIDINARAIAAARRATPPADAETICFEVASSCAAEAESSYDAVFALAVFQDSALHSAPPRCDHLLRFADFDRAVSDLARCLKPGGLLFLRFAHFRFADSKAAEDFELVLTLESGPRAEPRPLYGADNGLITANATIEDVAWRKRGGAGSAPDTR